MYSCSCAERERERNPCPLCFDSLNIGNAWSFLKHYFVQNLAKHEPQGFMVFCCRLQLCAAKTAVAYGSNWCCSVTAADQIKRPGGAQMLLHLSAAVSWTMFSRHSYSPPHCYKHTVGVFRVPAHFVNQDLSKECDLEERLPHLISQYVLHS